MPAALSVAEILNRIQLAHSGNISILSQLSPIGDRGRVAGSARFLCKSGHEWNAPVGRVFSGHGCPKCSLIARSRALRTPLLEIEKLIAGRFKLIGSYTNMNAKADFLCLSCNQEVNIQLRQACYAPYGCPHCANKGRAKIGGHSKLSIRWVDYIAKTLHLKFQHNENGGEALLELGLSSHRSVTPVDGYNAYHRIICEYDGDYWHKRHDRRTKQYKKTLERTNRMLELGYIVIHIWGKDYERGYVETVLSKDSRGKRFAKALGAEFIQTDRIREL